MTPIIARIYQPEAYGQFAVFNALVANLSIVATLNLINAFVLPRNVRHFIPLVQLTLMVILVVTLLTFIGLVAFQTTVLTFFNISDLGNLIYFIPVFVLFTGLNRCLDYWNVRETEYKTGATAKIISVIGAKIFTIGLGLFTKGSIFGFILGDLLSRPIHSYALISKSIRKDLTRVRTLSWPRIIATAREYKNYPLYNMPANGLIVLAAQLPIYLLTFYFGASMTGHFSLAYSLTAAPIQVLGISVASVFYQKAVETQQKNPLGLGRITVKLLNQLILIGALPFGALVVFGDLIFVTVFGNNWQLAGIFAGYMGFMAYANFISVSLTSLFRVMRRERLHFYINLSGSIILCAGLFLAINKGNAHYLVLVFSIVSAFLHLILILIACRVISVNPAKSLAKLVGSISLVILIMYLIRNFYNL